MMAANTKKKKPVKGKKKKSAAASARKRWIIIACVILGVVLSVGGYKSAIWLIDNRLPAFRQTGYLQVQPGMTVGDLAEIVIEELKPRVEISVYRTLHKEIEGRELVPGLYRITTRNSMRYMARAVTRGWQSPIDIVISTPVRSRKQLAAQIASQMMVSEEQLLKAFNSTSLLAEYGTTPDKLFEMVLPDTYQMYWSASVREIFGRLKKERDRYWTTERVELARKQGLTPEQVSILASIVAEESHMPDEYPKIASVYLTRLKKGMKLQACPTVCYIYNYEIRRVLNQHLSNPSPYNTYRYAGLPPGPICLPSKEHIEAVLHPDPHNYLYFCADPSFNGRNVFAQTYKEHLVNANAYRKALDQQMALKKLKD